MNFDFLKSKSPDIFTEFATKSFSEAVKVAMSALAIANTHSIPIGAIVGAGAMGFTDKLLSKPAEIEKKIDKLLRLQTMCTNCPLRISSKAQSPDRQSIERHQCRPH